MNHSDFPTSLTFRARESTDLALRIPVDALTALSDIAAEKDMSVEALARLYIGQGLRQDIEAQYYHRLRERTMEVLEKHGQSPEVAAAIAQEIWGA